MAEEARSNVPQENVTKKKRTAKVLSMGTTLEGIAAGFAVAMAIIGLVGMYPTLLVAASIIVVGIGLFFEGTAISAKFKELVAATTRGESGKEEVSGGAAIETLGGLLAIALGVLAILEFVPATLIPSAIIVIGACMVLGAATNVRMIYLSIARPEQSSLDKMARHAAFSATGLQVIIGFGAIALGILALLDISPLLLSLIAVLAIAGSMLLSSSSLTGRLMSQLRY